MLVAAALVPDTALLVPGAGGDADAGAVLRGPTLAAVGDALAASGAAGAPGRVAVVAPGRVDRSLAGPVRGSLQAAGIPDELVGWPPPGPAAARVAGVPASVALYLLARHGVAADRVEEVGCDERAGRAAELGALGARLVGAGPTALVVVGSPSGRHGPQAPLPDDERAPAYDDALVADLADAGPGARARLAGLDPGLARELAVTGWGPWQVLLGAAGGAPVTARLVARHVLAGATHAVVSWRASGDAR